MGLFIANGGRAVVYGRARVTAVIQ